MWLTLELSETAQKPNNFCSKQDLYKDMQNDIKEVIFRLEDSKIQENQI